MVAHKRLIYKLIKRDGIVVPSACYVAANYANEVYQTVHLVPALCDAGGAFELAYASLTACISQHSAATGASSVDSILVAALSYCNQPVPAVATTSTAIATTTASLASAPSSASAVASPSAASSTSDGSSLIASSTPAASASTSSSAVVVAPTSVTSSTSAPSPSSATSLTSSSTSSATSSALGASSSIASRSSASTSASTLLSTSSSSFSLNTSTTEPAHATQLEPVPTHTTPVSNSLSVGAIVGIAVGATIAVIVALSLAIFFVWRYYRKLKSKKQAAVAHPGDTTEKPQLHSDPHHPRRTELEGSIVTLPVTRNSKQITDIHELEPQDLSRIRSEMSTNEVAATELGNFGHGSQSDRVAVKPTLLTSGVRSVGGGGVGDG